jgi:hypothetical protein
MDVTEDASAIDVHPELREKHGNVTVIRSTPTKPTDSLVRRP